MAIKQLIARSKSVDATNCVRSMWLESFKHVCDSRVEVQKLNKSCRRHFSPAFSLPLEAVKQWSEEQVEETQTQLDNIADDGWEKFNMQTALMAFLRSQQDSVSGFKSVRLLGCCKVENCFFIEPFWIVNSREKWSRIDHMAEDMAK